MNLNKDIRMKRKRLLPFFLFLLLASNAIAQMPIGEWRDHFPYNHIIMMTETPDRIYAASPTSLFYINKSDNSVVRLSKVNGLSDVGISAIAYNTKQSTLVVAYTNANIDFIQNDVVTNISDIKRKSIPGNKVINNIYCDSNFAYMACGFGVVVLDVKRNEVKETWIVGDQSTNVNILDLDFFQQKIYLSTPTGILSADKNSPNLVSYTSWVSDTNSVVWNKRVSEVEHFGNFLIAHVPTLDSSYTYLFDGTSWLPIVLFNNSKKYSIISSYNKLVVTYAAGNVVSFDPNFNQIRVLATYNPGFIDSHFAKYDRTGDLWICDNNFGIIQNEDWNEWISTRYLLNGPNTADIWQVVGNDKMMITIKGGMKDNWSNLWTGGEFSSFSDDSWTQYDRWNNIEIDSLSDILYACVDPNEPNSFWLSSWWKGLIHVQNKVITEVLNAQNTPSLEANSSDTYIGGLCFDKNKNLWIVNSNTDKVLKVKTPNNLWYQFSLSPYANNSPVSTLTIDSSGYKWMLLPKDNGLIVYDDNGTISNPSDDRVKLLNINLNTRVSTNVINCFVQDLNGDMWVGTDKGIKVFYSTADLFSTANPSPQTILIEQDGYVQNLLEFENVTSIAIDGANRKWIGTSKAGLFVISPDGTTELGHFTESNSSLISDEISSLAFNQKNGEIFIGTKKGLISYRTNATMGVEAIVDKEVYAFPNPVKEGYNGEIAIKGLTTNANVKITNVNGVLVFQTIANGGQAIWNGKNFSGEKVATGVYLVFASNEDGSQKVATKILFIK